MDIKSKILYGFLAAILILSSSASYYRFMVLNDYIVEAQVDCDPTLESCFVWECDPSVESECTGNEEEDTWHFKYAYRNAGNIPECTDDTCSPFECSSANEADCSEVTCNEDSRQKYEIEHSCVTQTSDDEIVIDEKETPLDSNLETE